MKNILDDLVKIEEKKSLEILDKIVKSQTMLQLKAIGENKVLNTEIKKVALKNYFYFTCNSEFLESKPEITLKINFNNKLYFLKTNILKVDKKFCFDNCINLFELVRRQSSRFQIPDDWLQSAHIQLIDTSNALKSIVRIVEMSLTGMRFKVGPLLPRYEKDQIVNLKFKIHRRGEVVLRAKIVHLKKCPFGGPLVGVQFIDSSTLLKNKIQNIYADLAFFHVNQSGA